MYEAEAAETMLFGGLAAKGKKKRHRKVGQQALGVLCHVLRLERRGHVERADRKILRRP